MGHILSKKTLEYIGDSIVEAVRSMPVYGELELGSGPHLDICLDGVPEGLRDEVACLMRHIEAELRRSMRDRLLGLEDILREDIVSDTLHGLDIACGIEASTPLSAQVLKHLEGR